MTVSFFGAKEGGMKVSFCDRCAHEINSQEAVQLVMFWKNRNLNAPIVLCRNCARQFSFEFAKFLTAECAEPVETEGAKP